MSNSQSIPEFSIIIPLWVDSERFYTDLIKFNDIQELSYELIVVHDNVKHLPKSILNSVKNCNFINTNLPCTGPAEKRDLASKLAKGKYLAFIDDDAYPDKNWLKEIKRGFSDPSVVSVGGPGVTPPDEGFFEKVSGKIYESYFCSGLAQNRFISKNETFVTDWPAYNLVVQKQIFNKIGGFNVKFYGGEDTFLCLKLLEYGKIKYNPDAIVYHHRRPIFIPLLKQIYNIGKHRGYFFKKFPQNSRKLFYTIPSILTVGLIFLTVSSFFSFYFLYLLIFFLFMSLIFSFFSISNERTYSLFKNLQLKFLGCIGIIGVHLSYGTSFLHGLLTKDLDR